MMETEYRTLLYERYFSNQGADTKSLIDRWQHRQYYNNHFLTQFMLKDKNIRVLDIGCGDGTLLASLQNLGYLNITGVDRSPESINLLQSNNLDKYVVQADFTEFLEEAYNKKLTWDVVIAIDIFEHFTKNELIHILASIRNILTPHGILIIKVPNAQSPILAGTTVFGDFTHEIAFTPTSMTQVLRACGFSSIETYEAAPIRCTFISSTRFYLWQLVRLFYIFLYAVETGSLNTSMVWTRSFFTVAQNPVCLEK